MTSTEQQRVEEIAGRLTKAQRFALTTAREGYHEPPRCYGPGVTRKALRERGLAHGDFAYLTPLGLAVRTHLQGQAS